VTAQPEAPGTAPAPQPLRAALAEATATLAAAGVDSARHDAEALAAHLLGVPRSRLVLVDTLDGVDVAAFGRLVQRRAGREPLQHLLGSTAFRRLELEVGPGVFVPRPETESVVGWALDAMAARGWDAPLVVDLCTGSGTIALSVAQECPGATVYAVERSAEAVVWTRCNAATRAAAGDTPVTVVHGDAADALPELDGRVDVVLSNPPYVAEHEAAQVDPEVLDHDPHEALFAGSDGLDVVRIVAVRAADLLHPGGLLVVEHSDRQGETAPALLRSLGGWSEVADHRDLVGRDRFVTAVRSPGTPPA
jgi:release factor glutamine methyltransferase